jgi:hypothetical protein
MPISLNNLVKDKRTFSIPFEGGDINVTYNPQKMSAAHMQELQDRLDEDDPYSMAVLFCGIVTDWDLIGPMHEEGHNEFIAAGKPIPVEPRYVAWIPGPVLQAIFTAIGEDASPKSPQKPSAKR